MDLQVDTIQTKAIRKQIIFDPNYTTIIGKLNTFPHDYNKNHNT